MPKTLMLVSSLLVLAGPAVAQDVPLDVSAQTRWAGKMGQSCAGLTMGWHPLLRPLAGMVGTNWQPAPGPIPQRGTFTILTIKCDNSTIDGARTGPIVVAFGIIPVVPFGEPDAKPVVAFSRIVAPAGSKASAMFKRLGFEVLDGDVELVFDDARGVPKATFAIAAGPTRITATADFPTGGSARSAELRAVGTQPGVFTLLDGQSQSVVTDGSNGVILGRGTDLFSRLDLDDAPPIVELGREFRWDFLIQRGEFSPR